MLSAVQHQSKKEKIMLETEIKELTKAINAATEAVKVLTESLRSPVNAATDCEEEEPVKRQETLDDPQDQDITADGLQAMCMKAVRADEKNRQITLSLSRSWKPCSDGGSRSSKRQRVTPLVGLSRLGRG